MLLRIYGGMVDGLDVTYTEGNIYSRATEITGLFGGSGQSGIAPSARVPAIFIFTGEEGEKFGYVDHWDDARQVFTYTGEGQLGPMHFTRGNAAIRNHVGDGRALHLFAKVARAGGQYRYEGEMQCASTSIVRGPDKQGTERDIIQFELVSVRAIPTAGEPLPPTLESSLSDLRNAAYGAVRPAGSKVPTNTPRSIYARSQQVVTYVLARASGQCECCGAGAPFVRSDGSPYLEAHHTQRLSDNGLDSPDFVAAICPTCHRRIHHGSDGKHLNASLRASIAGKEQAIEIPNDPKCAGC